MGDIELKKLCLEIFKKYPEAYRSMIYNLPSLNDLKDEYFKKINTQYPVVNTWEWPKGQKYVTSLFVRNPNWKIEQATIQLFLNEDSYAINIFATLPKSDVEKCGDKLKKIFGKYPYEVIDGWAWWCFTNHDVIEIPNIDTFGEKTAQAAFKKFEEIYCDINNELLNC